MLLKYCTFLFSISFITLVTAIEPRSADSKIDQDSNGPARLSRRQFPEVTNCDTKQTAIILKADRNALNAIGWSQYLLGNPGAIKYLHEPYSNPPKTLGEQWHATYVKWFGPVDEKRLARVTSHFKKMSQAPEVNYVCGSSKCKKGDFAFVKASDPIEMNLCSAFFKAPACGLDSQMGTLVHERSHYSRNGATQDLVGTPAGARALAKRDPDEATFNAYSHEYYIAEAVTQSAGYDACQS